MMGNRKEEGRVSIAQGHFLGETPTPFKNRLTTQSSPSQGFKPGPLRQNAVTLPLVPLPPIFNTLIEEFVSSTRDEQPYRPPR